MKWTRIVWQSFRNDRVKGLLNYCKICSFIDPYKTKTLLFNGHFLPMPQVILWKMELMH